MQRFSFKYGLYVLAVLACGTALLAVVTRSFVEQGWPLPPAADALLWLAMLAVVAVVLARKRSEAVVLEVQTADTSCVSV